jgi:hypothetical protein
MEEDGYDLIPREKRVLRAVSRAPAPR